LYTYNECFAKRTQSFHFDSMTQPAADADPNPSRSRRHAIDRRQIPVESRGA
jgi:hypothetical protein